MMTIAYGGSGFCYFTYWTPPGDWQTGLIDTKGNPTVQYAQAQRINKAAYAIGKRTVLAGWQGAYHNGGLSPNTAPLPAFAPVYVPSTAPLVVGLFYNSDGSVYALLVNRDHDHVVNTSVVFASADGQPMALDTNQDRFLPLTMKANTTQLTFSPGQGILVSLKGPVPKGPGGPLVYAGLVRNNAGLFVVVDSHFGTQALGGEGWGFCPMGYSEAGLLFNPNGFWLCVRSDVASRTFFLGNTVSDQAHMYRISGGSTVDTGPASWNTCPQGTLLGTYFTSNGFWICIV